MIRRLAGVLAATLVLAAASASPALAANEIALSSDGQHWSRTLTQPLFDPAVLWVPGDSRTASFYVRNEAASAGDLAIAVRSDDPDRLLADDHVGIQARAGAGPWVALEAAGSLHRLAAAAIPAGSRIRLEVRASFDALSANQTQVDRAGLTFVVGLAEALTSGGTGPQDDDTDGGAGGPTLVGSGPLARTGAAATGWLLIIAAMALGVGAALKRAGGHP